MKDAVQGVVVSVKPRYVKTRTYPVMSQYQIDEVKRVEVSRQIATNKGVIKIQDWKNGEKLPLRPPTHSMSGYDTGRGRHGPDSRSKLYW